MRLHVYWKQLIRILMDDNSVVIKKDMLFDDDMWRQLNKEFEPRELKCVFYSQEAADAFDKAIKEYYAAGEKSTMKLKHFRSTRGKAMKWWSDLSFTEQGNLMGGDYKHRHPQSLTGREIEMLHKAENKQNQS